MLAVDLVSSAVSAPASEVISQTVEAIFEIVAAANDVLVKKDTFKELASYVVRVVPILRELNKKTVVHSESLNNVMEILYREIRAAKQLTHECSKRNKVYLLMNCRNIVKRLEDIMREISRALSLLPLTSLDLSSGIIEEIEKLCDNMQRAEFRAAIAEEEILDKIDSGIQERNMDRSYANNLLVLIAEAVGISTERSVLKKELEEFRSEIENARLRKDQAEAIQMEQIIALLERADAASSPREKEMKYIIKRKSLGGQPLEPLQSFICPITREVMVDPVETSSGQTFERSAIEKWFADGNTSCPLTMTSLDTSILRPNKTLRQSIEEWKDRNTMIMIASLKSKLQSEEDEEVLHCLGELLDLCKERDLHKEWVILENYIPILIQLLGVKNPEIRNHALVNLCILVKDSDDAKERINKADNGIESIVRSLGRRVEERKLAVALLLELSKSNPIREQIGKVQGSILLLVTMSNSDDNRAAKDARELLENLSFSDQNVIQMAKANYFTHLLQRLSAGPEDVKMAMASNLAEMELTDHNKESLIEGGVLCPLLYLVSHGDIPIKTVAVKALRNLSSLPKNGLQMIREGAERPLLDLLFNLSSSLSSLREYLAATIMHLAMSVSLESSQTPVSFLESDEDILKLFSLINLMGPNVQKSIIRTFHTLCQSPSAISIKTKLIQSSAIQVLVQLCENDDLNLRANAVKLFSCLVEGGSESTPILEHVNQKCIETILKIIKVSDDEEEIASAMGIISNLPEIPKITQWLVDAGALPAVFSFLQNGKQNGPHKNQLIENAVGAICRFTVSTNLEWQKSAAEAGIIPLFVQLLESGTSLTKKRAAISLSRFSESSPLLSRSLPNRKGFCCFSAPPETARLLLVDYIPSTPDFWSTLRNASSNEESIAEFNHDVLVQIINRPADGGITALHMAALNGHVESVQLLLDLGASVFKVTVQDGTTIDLIGAGSTALHYAACGGNAQCCQILISRGASLNAENANGWTPLMVARSWHRDWLEEILSTEQQVQSQILPSPYLSLPLMSIVKIARECGWRNSDSLSTCQDPCVVCLEQQCTVAAEGCDHEFCTRCALYLCSTNCTTTVSHGPPGSIACPLCRSGIVSFVKLRGTRSVVKENPRTSLSLSLCSCSAEEPDSASITTPLCKPEFRCSGKSPLGSFRSLSCQKFPSFKINYNLCMGAPNINPCLVPSSGNRKLRNHLARCSRSGFRRSASQPEARRSWFSALNQNVTTGSGC